ncbi:MAG: hypothetical protein GY845_20725 [Planctomycetes bacterium]|nr:hypothetical protein [Planctomycetota bacterium]
MTNQCSPKLLSDVPFSPEYAVETVDVLGQRDAETMAAAIRNSIGPLVFGVFGEWGSGKTSFLNLARSEIRKQKETPTPCFETVLFNPWEHQGASNLIVPLMHQIAADSKMMGKVKNELAKLGGIVAKAASIHLVSGLTRGRISLQEIENYEKRYIGELDELALLRKNMQDLFRRVLSPKARLCIFVDDLDRCLPETALGLLEAVKLFLDVENCAYVVAADDKMLMRAIASRYAKKNSESSAKESVCPKEYLEKLVQVIYQVRPLTHSVRKTYLDYLINLSCLNNSCKLCDVINNWGPSNPRRLKKIVNSLVMAQIHNNNVDLAPLSLLLCIQVEHPDIFAKFTSTETCVGDLSEEGIEILKHLKNQAITPTLIELADRYPPISSG